MWPFKKKTEPKELQFDPASFDGPKVIPARTAFDARLQDPKFVAELNARTHLWTKAPTWAKPYMNPTLRVTPWSEAKLRTMCNSHSLAGRHVAHTIRNTRKPHYVFLLGRWTRFVIKD